MTLGGDPNIPNLEDLLRLGINTAKAGNKENARVIFQQVLSQDKRNERAWLWLASVEENPLEQRRLLQTVLAINPRNRSAKKLLNAMDQKIVRSERASMRLGITLLVGLIVFLVIVAVLVIAIT